MMRPNDLQDVAHNQQQLDAFVPEDMVRAAVRSYLTCKRGERQIEAKGGFPDPREVVQQITLERLEPVLTERFGATGRFIARQTARFAGSIMAVRAGVYDMLGSDARYREQLIEGETTFACRELVRAWNDALLILATDETFPPSGSAFLDAWLFPKTEGADPRGGSPVPELFHTVFPNAKTWRDVFLQSTAHLALDEDARIRAWEQFAYACRVLVAEHEDCHPEVGFLLDRDDEHEFLLRYFPHADGYALQWRPRADLP